MACSTAATRRWRRLGLGLGLACGVACALSSPSAHAHHPIVPNGVNQALVANRIIVTQSSARFALTDARGQWWLTSLAFELAPIDQLALLGAVSLGTIRHEDGYQVTGPADTDIGLKVALWSSPERRVSLLLGTVLELPTGDAYERLGSGHYELTPSVVLQWQPTAELSFLFAVSDRFAIADASSRDAEVDEPSTTPTHNGGKHKLPSQTDEPIVPSHGALPAPHADHEGHLTVNAGYRWRQLYASVEHDLAIIFDGAEGESPLGPLIVTPELGAFPRDDIRVAARVTLPVAGPKRAQFTGALEFTYIF